MSSCSGLRQALVDCIKESECMKARERPFHDCLHDVPRAKKECFDFYQGWFQCRRGNLDMRQRFRGVKDMK